MAGDSGMAGKVALLLWAQTLSLAGAQTTQLLVDPLWTPAVLWDRVTLTCQGSGTPSATTWYKDGKRWGKNKGLHQFRVSEVGTYECHRPGSGRSSAVTVVNDEVVLQVPAWALLEGDRVTLRCRRSSGKPVRDVRFYRGEEEVSHTAEDFSLYSLRFSDSGVYSCKSWERCETWCVWVHSEPVTVTVHGLSIWGVSLSAQPPGGQVALGDSLVLSCTVAAGTGPLSFSWHREGSGTLLGTGDHLELRSVGVNDSGHYRCRASDGDRVAESPTLNVTVLDERHPRAGDDGTHGIPHLPHPTHIAPLSPPPTPDASSLSPVSVSAVPVANATITPGPPALQVSTGYPLTLHCSVQVGSAPVTFTWLRDGREVAQGPLLELGDIDVGHSGTYQCVATNQLNRVVSPELALEVTPRGHWGTGVTAVAAGVGGSLLLLVLLLAVILGWRRWHHTAARKPQGTVPSAPPEDGEVLYTQVVSTARAAGPPRAASPQVTYAELPGPRGRQQDSGDIYENAL